jgi:hypothetical protein
LRNISWFPVYFDSLERNCITAMPRHFSVTGEGRSTFWFFSSYNSR